MGEQGIERLLRIQRGPLGSHAGELAFERAPGPAALSISLRTWAQ